MPTPFSDEPSQLERDCLDYLDVTGEVPDLQTILLLREARASTELDRGDDVRTMSIEDLA